MSASAYQKAMMALYTPLLFTGTQSRKALRLYQHLRLLLLLTCGGSGTPMSKTKHRVHG
jgi:hypothetical protein